MPSACIATSSVHATCRVLPVLLTYGLFKYAFRSSYIASNGRINERRIGNDVEGIGCGLFQGTIQVYSAWFLALTMYNLVRSTNYEVPYYFHFCCFSLLRPSIFHSNSFSSFNSCLPEALNVR
jgi:hypothetical protein